MPRVRGSKNSGGSSQGQSGYGKCDFESEAIDIKREAKISTEERTSTLPDANAKELSGSEESEQDSALSKPVVKAVEAPTPTKLSDQNIDRSGSANWGDLPRHAQRVFRAEGGGEIPTQYRDWIDAYYRKLNSDSR